MNNQFQNEPDELTWQAFQYVAGELSAADADLFEERLADDQSAREAVAQAVALFHTVCAVEAAEPVVAIAAKSNSLWSQKLVWLAAGSVAAAVLVAAVLNLNLFSDSQSPAAKNVAAVTPALADAWSAVRADFASDEPVSPSVAASAVLSDVDLAIAEEDLALATETPSWMTAAVLGLSGKTPLNATESQPQEN